MKHNGGLAPRFFFFSFPLPPPPRPSITRPRSSPACVLAPPNLLPFALLLRFCVVQFSFFLQKVTFSSAPFKNFEKWGKREITRGLEEEMHQAVLLLVRLVGLHSSSSALLDACDFLP
jgi:hypothetical protein